MNALPESFWTKTSRTDCIVWTGAQNSKGYGCYAVGGVSQLAHRVAWEATRGPIPEALTIDHLCRVRCCVNVEHMELVTVGENSRRARGLSIGDTCSRGHSIQSEADLYVRVKRGTVECRACRTRQRVKTEVAA